MIYKRTYTVEINEEEVARFFDEPPTKEDSLELFDEWTINDDFPCFSMYPNFTHEIVD